MNLEAIGKICHKLTPIASMLQMRNLDNIKTLSKEHIQEQNVDNIRKILSEIAKELKEVLS